MAILEFVVGPARVAFTDRHGGVSPPPYDTANLGFATGDDPDAVAENRRRIATELGGAATAADRWVWVHQVHGSRAVRVSRPSDAGTPADALVTATDGLPLMVLTADCVPVALVTDAAVGAVHAGWRGL